MALCYSVITAQIGEKADRRTGEYAISTFPVRPPLHLDQSTRLPLMLRPSLVEDSVTIIRKLRRYQERALLYCRTQRHPALFLQMRLGKTLIVIRRIRELGLTRILVVAPNSALGSWEEELAKEHEDRVYHLIGSKKDRLFDLTNFKYATSFPTDLRAWCLINKEAHLCIPQIKEIKWDAVILDESVFIANPRSKVSHFFVKNFRGVPYRFALTGMPNPESDIQLVQQMLWLDYSYLGYRTFWHFRAGECEPDEVGHHFEPTSACRQKMAEHLKKRAFVLNWREAGLRIRQIRQVRYIELPKQFRTTYRTVERDFILEHQGKEIARSIWSLTSYHWLRRLAGGFMLRNENDPEPDLVWQDKIDEVVSLVTGELKSESIVIWFNYNLERAAVKNSLENAGVPVGEIWGDLTVQEREQQRLAFQKGEIRVLCIQQAVARSGMNLSRAGAAIYYSEPLGLDGRKQTEYRVLNPADERGKLYIHLLTKNTVDEDIYAANNMKSLQSSITLSKALLHSAQLRRRVMV